MSDTPLTLEQALERIKQLEQGYEARMRLHFADVEQIGARLMKEADARGWCSVYDAVVSELNEGLHIELPVREYEYEVVETYTVRIARIVTANNASEAETMVGDDISTRADGEASAFRLRPDVIDAGWRIVDHDFDSVEAGRTDED